MIDVPNTTDLWMRGSVMYNITIQPQKFFRYTTGHKSGIKKYQVPQ